MSSNSLPKWNDLSQEQKNLVEYSAEKNFVIEGAPGTGKTIIALYRMANIVYKNKDRGRFLILVFNKPLCENMKALISTRPKIKEFLKNVEINTYHSWLGCFYKQNFYNKSLPTVNADDKNSKSFKQPDFEIIKKDLEKYKNFYTYIIVDEAQDFPFALMEILNNISKNITICLDPNQKIHNKIQKREIDKIITMLIPNQTECKDRLLHNYRNTKPIVELSHIFFSGQEFIDYNIKNSEGKKPKYCLCNNLDEQLNKMKNIISRNKGMSVGIIVDSANNIDYVHKFLLQDMQIPIERIQKYITDKNTNYNNFNTLNFYNDKCIRILSYNTNKGLEFDIVILLNFNKIQYLPQNIGLNRAYVAITRAKKELYIFADKEKNSDCVDTDSILEKSPELWDKY